MKQRSDPLTASAVLLCVEIVQRVERNCSHWDVVLSRAGNDSTFRKTWDNHSGRLSASQAEDLCNWVQLSAMNALVAWGGIQTELPTG